MGSSARFFFTGCRTIRPSPREMRGYYIIIVALTVADRKDTRLLKESVMPRKLALAFLLMAPMALMAGAASAKTLWDAVAEGDAETARELIAGGANVNVATKNGTTPLVHAAELGHLEIVKTLIANGADVNARLKPGYTALMLAADNGHAEIVRLLIENGADVNAMDNSGGTALRYAMTDEIARILKSAGARR